MAEGKWTLTYFQGIYGRAETMRMMLYIADRDYISNDVDFSEWMDLKPKTPLGALPMLETKEGRIVQCTAIANYVARELGFLPESDWEKAVCDSILVSLNDTLQEVAYKVYVVTVYKNTRLKQEVTDAQLEENKAKCCDLIQRTFAYVESQAKPGAKFIFGNKMTVADIAFYNLMKYVDVEFKQDRPDTEVIRRWTSNFESDQKMAKYLQTRPPSQFGT